MWKKIYPYLIGFVIGIVTLWAISSGYSNKKIEQLTNTINNGKILNTKLQDTNTKLSEANTRLIAENRTATEGLEGLRKQIRDGNIQYQNELGKIKSGFNSISEGLGTIENGLGNDEQIISNVIDGIEAIKNFISTIKFN